MHSHVFSIKLHYYQAFASKQSNKGCLAAVKVYWVYYTLYTIAFKHAGKCIQLVRCHADVKQDKYKVILCAGIIFGECQGCKVIY